MTYEWPKVDMQELRAWRTERVVEMMRSRGLDHLVLTGFDSIRYAIDYRTQIIAEAYDWFAAVVDADGVADLLVPWIDEPVTDPEPELPMVRSIRPLPSWTPAGPHSSYWITELASLLEEGRRVGCEMLDPEILYGLADRLPSVEWVPVSAPLNDIRQVKHPIELVLLEHTSIVNAAAARHAVDSAEPGMTDFDVLSSVMGYLQKEGVEFLSHSLCNHGRGSGTWFAQGSVLKEGDTFFFDIGCYGLGGYASDIARTGFVGEPRPEVASTWKTLLEAYLVGQEKAKPGVKASEVHEAINAHLQAAGLPRTPYSMGHGVGLRACELPTIHRADRMGRDQIIQEGSVISLEPETAVEVDGKLVLLKIEDNFVVESDGLRLVSSPSQMK